MSSAMRADVPPAALPDAKGRFGAFGGRYVPETLVPALDRLQAGIDRYLHQRGVSSRVLPRNSRPGWAPDGAVVRAHVEHALGRARSG